MVESDPAVRFEIYTEAQRLVMADMPWVPLYMPINKFAVNTARISGAATLHSFMVLDNAVVGE
jgi:peptide/nickel transport system substrate-binding protein